MQATVGMEGLRGRSETNSLSYTMSVFHDFSATPFLTVAVHSGY